jgi:hypothetical protein
MLFTAQLPWAHRSLFKSPAGSCHAFADARHHFCAEALHLPDGIRHRVAHGDLGCGSRVERS